MIHRDHLIRDSHKAVISTIYWRHFFKQGFKTRWFLNDSSTQTLHSKLTNFESRRERVFQEYGLILVTVEDYAIVLDHAKSVWNGSYQNLSDNDCIKIELSNENNVVRECLLMFQIPYETPYHETITNLLIPDYNFLDH